MAKLQKKKKTVAISHAPKSDTNRDEFHHFLNILEPEFYIYILAHSVGKMRIIQEPKNVALWNKRHFEEKKTEIMQHV